MQFSGSSLQRSGTLQLEYRDCRQRQHTRQLADCQVFVRLVAPNQVRALHLARKGRGYALKQAWLSSRAAVVAYMDVDLSTDIGSTGSLILPLLQGGADIALGSRLLPQSQVTRSPKREFISRTYNLMLRSYLAVSFHDAQCGFKAITAQAAHVLLPQMKDDEWFFDTELLV